MKFQLALCQMKVVMDKSVNLKTAERMIREASKNGAQVIALPEMFNCPYSNKYFREYGEPENGETCKMLSSLAKELKVTIIGGSIPELAEDRVYNTSYSFSKDGEMIGKHRKIHLFDIDVKGGIRFKESETLTAGNEITMFDTEFCKIGVAICYDVRFPELFRKMTLAGAKLIVLPGAFNMTTGPAHWDLTMRARALDNQIYFAAVSPARDTEGPYQAYGSSCVANPWGEFCGKADAREAIVYSEIDLEYLDDIRNQLPLLKHRKEELY
ncbi:carbon-nitrogen hydrolase family protein [Sinanaerobacter chloroacetimidivorans]|uniref:Carbon-nitrogen hydrolase family protein n=1 Tax=Sinanaerobacter chloroacetimidivorans TaxID=2818044 RepID=A0A8J7W1C3_9FIRM|nr:carbon-nitrogen hydrolase family protein [Sinanaerobacter chloroacetimidivorans]MBR0598997.1 carbon-nitrogen hydrolase family protein [Sinanaerobacter chloroacetimidivorans]